MKKMTVKIFMSSMILLFCASHLQAQASYTVHQITGKVEMMSDDEKVWKPIKEGDKLKESYQIKLYENSSVVIVDKNNQVYACSGANTLSVKDIIKPRKTNNENADKRNSFLVAHRNDIGGDTCTVCLHFKKVGNPNWYDLKFISTGSVFYIVIFNYTKKDIIVNVYQELENKELISCLPENIHLEKETAVEFTDFLFLKQENSKFIISYSEKE